MPRWSEGGLAQGARLESGLVARVAGEAFGLDPARLTVLRLVGQRREAVQYLVGNPLFAVEMTRHASGAALYAPLRVLIYEADGGGACVEYDLPSSLFGQFADERVDRVAAGIDQKLADLVSAATR